MRTVYKYEVKSHRHTFMMPMGAKIVHVNMQNYPCLWAEVDTELKTVQRDFEVYGTGQEIPSDLALNYVGTVHTTGLAGELVWHIYERNRP